MNNATPWLIQVRRRVNWACLMFIPNQTVIHTRKPFASAHNEIYDRELRFYRPLLWDLGHTQWDANVMEINITKTSNKQSIKNPHICDNDDDVQSVLSFHRSFITFRHFHFSFMERDISKDHANFYVYGNEFNEFFSSSSSSPSSFAIWLRASGEGLIKFFLVFLTT
jgi:hypothetical protein